LRNAEKHDQPGKHRFSGECERRGRAEIVGNGSDRHIRVARSGGRHPVMIWFGMPGC